MKLSLEIEYMENDKVVLKIEQKVGQYVVSKINAEFDDTNLGEAENFTVRTIRGFFNKICWE